MDHCSSAGFVPVCRTRAAGLPVGRFWRLWPDVESISSVFSTDGSSLSPARVTKLSFNTPVCGENIRLKAGHI